MALLLSTSVFAQANQIPEYYRISRNIPVYFPRSEENQGIYDLVKKGLLDKGVKLIDSTKFSALYIEEILTRQDRLTPEELADQEKLKKTMMNGKMVAQLLRIKGEVKDSLITDLLFTVIPSPPRTGKTFFYVKFDQSEYPVTASILVDNFIKFLLSVK